MSARLYTAALPVRSKDQKPPCDPSVRVELNKDGKHLLSSIHIYLKQTEQGGSLCPYSYYLQDEPKSEEETGEFVVC